MALSTSTITGRVPLPTDENLQFAELTLALSGLDTEGSSVLPGGISKRVVLIDSDLPPGFELWQNTAGLRGTNYQVLARWTVKDRDGVRDQYADLGIIQVGSDPSYTLADLINNGVPPAIGTFWSAITQAQYDAVIQAAADALASATAAALYDGPKADTIAIAKTVTAGMVPVGGYLRIIDIDAVWQRAPDATPVVDGYPLQFAGGPKWFVLTPDLVAFDADPTGLEDSSPAIKAFARAIMSKNYGVAKMWGIFRVTEKIIFTPTVVAGWPQDVNLTRNFDSNATFKSDYSSTEEMMLFSGIPSLVITGNLQVYGSGTATFSTRTNNDGIVFDNCSRAVIGKLAAFYFRRDGIIFIGASSQPVVESIQAWYCGGGAGSSSTACTVNAVSITRTGSAASFGQRSVVTLDATPEGLRSDIALVNIGGECYNIKSVSGNVIEVLPWVAASFTSGPINIYLGGGLRTQGPDVSAAKIHSLDTLVCGIGHINKSLYPATVSSQVAQFCGVASCLGGSPSAAAVGGSIQYGYFEANDFDFIKATTYLSGFDILNTTNLNFAKTASISSPRDVGDKFSAVYSRLEGVAIAKNGKRYSVKKAAVLAGNDPNTLPVYSYLTNSATIAIQYDPDVSRLFGADDFFLMLRGTGTNKRPTGTITLKPPAGHSINGGAIDADYVLPAQAGPVLLHCNLYVTDWHIGPVGSIAQTAPVAPTGGSVIDAEARTALTALQTALKAAGILV